MSDPNQIVAGRAEDEEAALAAESATLAEEDAADAAARSSGGGSGADGAPSLDPSLDAEDDDPAMAIEDADDPAMPVEDVDVEEGVDELGDAPEGPSLTADETADIDEQLAAIHAANAQLPPDQQISTSPEDVN